MPRGCLRFVIVVFSDHTHLLFLQGNECISSHWNHLNDAVLISDKYPQPVYYLEIRQL